MTIFNPDKKLFDLSYFVEWRPFLWEPGVAWLLGNAKRFKGKRVLEIGCRYGQMSCLLGLFGAAEVRGIELAKIPLNIANAEAEKWGVKDNVSFQQYSGNPSENSWGAI